jgi:hypothetical protein
MRGPGISDLREIRLSESHMPTNLDEWDATRFHQTSNHALINRQKFGSLLDRDEPLK